MLLVVLSSLLPGLFWLWYFNRYDTVDKEPVFKLIQCMLYGAISVLFALLWEAPFRGLFAVTNSFLVQLLLSFLVVGFGEELFKFAAVYLAVTRSPHFNEPLDGIIYSISAAVGFSVIENVLYISAFGLVVAPLRGTIATLAHIAFSGLAGDYLGRAKFSAATPWLELVKGLALASFLHGFYDFFLITRLLPPLVLVGLVLALHYILLTRIRAALQRSPLQ